MKSAYRPRPTVAQGRLPLYLLDYEQVLECLIFYRTKQYGDKGKIII